MATSAAAVRRIVKSSLNWGKFAQKVPKEEVSNFQHFKARSDHYVARVQSLPDSFPQIDWSAYKKRAPAMSSVFDQLQKDYQSLQVPYPKADHLISGIDNQEKEQEENVRKWIVESSARVQSHGEELSLLESIPPLEHLEPEEQNKYFPGTWRDQKTDPYFYLAPEKEHDEIIQKYQPEYDFILSNEGEEDH